MIRKFLSLITYYWIFCFDMAGLVVVFVILSPVILSPTSLMVAPSTSIAMRNVIVGFLFAAYPFFQFFGATILGDFSDRMGRKPVLFFSLLLTVISNVLSALAIWENDLILLFVSRALGGLSAGNLTVAQASVANLFEGEKQAKYMALFSPLGGASWTVMPFVALFLSDSKIVPFFDNATPFWFLALVMLIALFLLVFVVREEKVTRTKGSFNVGRVYTSLFHMLTKHKVSHPLIASILMMIGWMIYQSFLAPYLIEKYQFTKDLEGIAYAVSSVAWLIGGFILSQIFIRFFKPSFLLTLPLYISALGILSFLIVTKSDWVWVSVSIANAFQAFATGAFFSLLSQLANPNEQGKVFGAWNAGFALGSGIAPIVSGNLANVWINLPYTVSGGLLLIFSTYYYIWHKRNKEA